MKNIRFSIFGFISLALFSCENITIGKDSNPNYNSEVTVTVTTNTGEAIPNLDLLLEPVKGYVSTSSGYKTDANGQMKFTYTGPEDGTMRIGYPGSNSFCSGGYDYIQPYKQRQYGFQLFPKGWIKLHVKNVNPQSPNDIISITASCYSVGYTGGLIDKTEFHKTGGNETKTINWTVHKNNVTTKFSDTLFIPWNDTVNYEILY